QLVQEMPEEYLIEVRWNDASGRSYSRCFVRKKTSPKAAPETLTWELEYDPAQQTQFLVLDNQVALVDCWIAGKTDAIGVADNFGTILPGKHRIELKSDKMLKKEDILLKYR